MDSASLPSTELWVATALGVILLAIVATLALGSMQVPHVWSVVLALGRATLQLAALSFILAGVITSPLWVGVALGVMTLAAIATAIRRARLPWGSGLPVAVAIIAGPAVVMAVVFVTGAIEFSPRYVLAIGGIIIGNAMSIAILTQRLNRELTYDHWGEVEGWLALGATRWESTRDLARRAIRTAIIPSIDQTRTTGIVVLPGAFVGAVFAGASPLEAGRFQLVVLAGILAAGSVTAVILTRMTGGYAKRPLGASAD